MSSWLRIAPGFVMMSIRSDPSTGAGIYPPLGLAQHRGVVHTTPAGTRQGVDCFQALVAIGTVPLPSKFLDVVARIKASHEAHRTASSRLCTLLTTPSPPPPPSSTVASYRGDGDEGILSLFARHSRATA